MKKIFFLFILVSFGFYCQGQVFKTDTTKEPRPPRPFQPTLAVSFQPMIGIDFIGAGFYVHDLLDPVGLYGSTNGIKRPDKGDQDKPVEGDDLIGTIVKRNWVNWNIGLTVRAVENFYLYLGYSLGKYVDWNTSTYQGGTISDPTEYKVVTEKKGKKPGADFGGIYYASSKSFRVGLQLGFNTSMQSVTTGLHLAVIIK